MSESASQPSRRRTLVAGLAAGASAVAGQAVMAHQESTMPATRSTDQQADGSTVIVAEGDDIGAAGRLLGRNYRPEEKELMRTGLERYRENADRLRKLKLPPSLESATLFDPVVAPDALPRGESSLKFAPPSDVEYDGDLQSLAFASIPTLAALLRQGKVTSVELTKLCLGRLRKHDPTLLCVVNLTEDRAMAAAARADEELAAGKGRGPLHGVPYGVKDLLATAGTPTTYGIEQYRDQVFDEDATVIQRLEEAGAVLVGKLTLGELAMGDVWFGGTTRNPWNPEQGSSGSSAGSCSAVAAGLVPFAIGSETHGSIVSPSMRCGTCALRPTYGRVPRTGAMPLARSMDKLGVVSRRIEDLAMVLHAIHGPDNHDRTCHNVPFNWPGPEVSSLRVGFDKVSFEAMERLQNREVKGLYRDALERCNSLFGSLQAVELPRSPLDGPVATMTIAAEGAESFEELVQADGLLELAQQEDWNWPNTFRRAGLAPAVDYVRAQRLRRRFMEQMAEAMGDLDLYVTVPRLGPNLVLTNLCGWPCTIGRLAVLEEKEGPAPHQIEFVGRPYGEASLLSAAAAFEAGVRDVDHWPAAFRSR